MIAMAGTVISAAICLVVFINQKEIQQIINQVDYYTTLRNYLIFLQILEEKECWKYNSKGERNWTLIFENTENSCILIMVDQVFPSSLYTWTLSHIALDMFLFLGAVYKYLHTTQPVYIPQ